ncbi:hypothetical protein EU537_01265 [Candidatus Thorarchaeota archaeon]|nr:MAG: hypothetical protein EU537_01265 [Candidatus Thorarchaeota archaeon]
MNRSNTITLIFIGAALVLMIFSPIPVEAEEVPIISRGQNLTLTAQVLQNGSYGDPVEFQPVEFHDETNDWLLGIEYTDKSGYATFCMDVPFGYPLGETIFNATYRGNETLALYPSCQWMPVLIVSSTNLEVTLSNTSLIYGDELLISAYLTDDTNNAIPNADITVIANGNTLCILQSDTDGYLSTSIITNSSWAYLGKNSLIFWYEGSSVNYHSQAMEELEIILSQIDTEIAANISAHEDAYLNTTWKTDVLLTDNDSGLSNECILVLIDEIMYMQVLTNETGWSEIEIDIDDSFSLGMHQLTIRYNGSIRNEPCTKTVQLSVLGQAYIVASFNASIAETYTSLSFGISVRDIFNRTIRDINISVQDTTTLESANAIFIPSSGKFVGYLFMMPPKGIHEIIVNVTDNQFLLNNSLITLLPVWSRPNIILLESNTMGYASPLQEVVYLVNISNFDGKSIQRNLSLIISPLDAPANQTLLTTNFQLGQISFTAPKEEGKYLVKIIYSGNESRMELPSNFLTKITISKLIPLTVLLKSYSQSGMMKYINVEILLFAQNGTRNIDINFAYWWLASEKQITKSVYGVVNLCLVTPLEAGVYHLSYEINEQSGITSTVGSFTLVITPIDANVASGIGVTPLASALIISCLILAIPFARKHYLIG